MFKVQNQSCFEYQLLQAMPAILEYTYVIEFNSDVWKLVDECETISDHILLSYLSCLIDCSSTQRRRRERKKEERKEKENEISNWEKFLMFLIENLKIKQ